MRTNTREMVLIALFAALTAIGAFIRFDIPGYPASFTLQIFFVVLAGMLLGAKAGFLSQGLYIMIGLIGIPIFAKGGGIGYIFNPSFGFLIGFALAAPVIGFLTANFAKGTPKPAYLFLSSLIGLIIVYVIGVPYMYMIVNAVLRKPMTLMQALWSGCLIFLPLDFLKIAAASFVAVQVKQRVSLST